MILLSYANDIVSDLKSKVKKISFCEYKQPKGKFGCLYPTNAHALRLILFIFSFYTI